MSRSSLTSRRPIPWPRRAACHRRPSPLPLPPQVCLKCTGVAASPPPFTETAAPRLHRAHRALMAAARAFPTASPRPLLLPPQPYKSRPRSSLQPAPPLRPLLTRSATEAGTPPDPRRRRSPSPPPLRRQGVSPKLRNEVRKFPLPFFCSFSRLSFPCKLAGVGRAAAVCLGGLRARSATLAASLSS
jgi:hypothetical protein